MLPRSTGISVPVKLKEVQRPSRTFALDVDSRKVVGSVDDLEAVRQAVYCILNTERYDHLIYSWNYGVELKDLYGRPLAFVRSELKRRIVEALVQDDRIKGVDAFDFIQNGRSLQVRFTVHTVFGDIRETKEVVT